MRKVKCSNGHFFDADRFATCPSCGAEPVGETPAHSSGSIERVPSTRPLTPPVGIDLPSAPVPNVEMRPSQKTETIHDDTVSQMIPAHDAGGLVPPHGVHSPTVIKSELTASVEATASQSTSPLPKTTAYYDAGEVDPPVGWLVCVRGIYKGHAFECKSGRNRIGRNLDMDICLSDDVSISRDTHAVIIYEPKERIFHLQAGTGSGLTYHNGSLIFDHEKIQPQDTIELGKAKFIFVPLCGESFTWDDYMTKD